MVVNECPWYRSSIESNHDIGGLREVREISVILFGSEVYIKAAHSGKTLLFCIAIERRTSIRIKKDLSSRLSGSPIKPIYQYAA
jgi:hypothetical protein